MKTRDKIWATSATKLGLDEPTVETCPECGRPLVLGKKCKCQGGP
jgi:hypothetical protein